MSADTTTKASTSPEAIKPPADTIQIDDIRNLTTLEAINSRLALIEKQESDLTLALNALISDRSSIDDAFSRLRVIGSEAEKLSEEVDGYGNDGRNSPLSFNGGLLGSKGNIFNGANGTQSRAGGGFGEVQGEGEGEIEGDGVVGRVKRVWEISEKVGGKVRKLDEEISRVKEAVDIVTEVMELRNALQTCSASIIKEDWESASRACKRAMEIKKDVIDGGFAGIVVPTPQQPLPPPQHLEELRNTLLHTFKTEFQDAARRKDQQTVSRFFRLWPGIDAEEEGLEAYGDFVVDLVKQRSSSAGKPSSPLYYLTQLTSLLESIAHIIDQHQPVVDKYYGDGRMKKVVQRLVEESDRVLRGLVEGWEEERRVGRLITETKQTRFPYLSNPALFPPLYQSLIPISSGNQISVSSIANTASSHLTTNISSATSLLQSYAPGSKRPPGAGAFGNVQPAQIERMGGPGNSGTGSGSPQLGMVEDEEQSGPDPKDVDKVLGELVAFSGRWALFRRFVDGRLIEEDLASGQSLTNGNGITKDHDAVKEIGTADSKKEDTGSGGPSGCQSEMLEQSGSHKAIQNLLRVYYEPLEMWFLRMSLEKAHRLDQPDTSSKPHLSSLVDDTFYLLKLIINRTLSCGSLTTLQSIRMKLSDVLEKDYNDCISRKMEVVYAAGVNEKERERSRDQRSAFIIYLNDLDVSADYMDRLTQSIIDNLPNMFLPVEVEAVINELKALTGTSDKFRKTAKIGLEQLFNQLIRPRLRGLLDECYKETNYYMDEEMFNEAEEFDLVRKKFIRAWEGLIEGYKDAFSDHNYQAFFNLTLETLVRPWEKVIMGMRITELGAIQYERDIRGISNYLSGQITFGGVREKFTRLQQIATVLNMDNEEDPEEFYSNSGIPWRLSKAEFNAVLEQRQ